jgi:hypothetical protein
MKMKAYRKHKGLLSVELVVAISVLAVIISVLFALNLSFGKLNNYLWAKHICYNAAQAQADAIASTGRPIDPQTFQRLWPQVTYTIERSDGSGPWEGLQKIDLTLRKRTKQKVVQVSLTRYLPPAKGGDR